VTAGVLSAFLDRVRAELEARGRAPERLLAELEDHLLERVSRLRARGFEASRAEREAVLDLGPPELIARRYDEEVPRALSLEVFMSPIAMALAALTSLGALLVAVHSLFLDPEGGPLWMAVKVGQSLAVIAAGALIVRHRVAPGRTTAALLLAGAVWLQVSGGAGFAWTLHLAEVTGDLEAWGLVLTLALAAQGALVTGSLWRERTRPA